ncbi:uncharacterized protein LOC144885065 isoform X1 [Branchiostoma floridae x Branchiostoma japonicum]
MAPETRHKISVKGLCFISLAAVLLYLLLDASGSSDEHYHHCEGERQALIRRSEERPCHAAAHSYQRRHTKVSGSTTPGIHSDVTLVNSRHLWKRTNACRTKHSL